MFNQFKLLLLVITLGVLGILFFQNQEPISLKLLCADPSSQYCWYQTPTQPLAMWMGLFLILGIVASLMWQLLQNLGLSQSEADYDYGEPYKPSPRQEDIYSRKSAAPAAEKTAKTTRKPSSTSNSDWEDSGQREDWEESQSSPTSKVDPTINRDDTIRGYSFEARQEPENINKSGSTYSVQFKKNPQSEDRPKNNQDEVYDANYRTINSPNRNNINQQTELDEDEEEWI